MRYLKRITTFSKTLSTQEIIKNINFINGKFILVGHYKKYKNHFIQFEKTNKRKNNIKSTLNYKKRLKINGSNRISSRKKINKLNFSKKRTFFKNWNQTHNLRFKSFNKPNLNKSNSKILFNRNFNIKSMKKKF